LIARVDIPGLFLGGGSGMEWRRPAGERFLADPNHAARLRAGRQAILPNLRILEQIPGIELEDKQCSIAVHVLRAPHVSRNLAEKVLSGLRDRRILSFFKGRAVYEIPFLPGMNKAAGVKRFSGILHFNGGGNRMVYAGDDENDATAMEWVTRQGGNGLLGGRRGDHPRCEACARSGNAGRRDTLPFQDRRNSRAGMQRDPPGRIAPAISLLCRCTPAGGTILPANP